MFKKRMVIALVVAATFPSGGFALDLTPHPMSTAEDGPAVPRYYFEDGGKQLSFKIDKQMTVTGADGSASFGFRDIANANMRLMKSPVPAGLALDDKTAETYRASARTFIPAQANDIQLQGESAGDIAINGWTSQQYKFLYALSGVRYCRSVTFINMRPGAQIVFDVNAPAGNYAKAYARSYRVLNSLNEVSAATKTDHS